MALVITSPGKFYGLTLAALAIGGLVVFRTFVSGAVVLKTGDFVIESGTSSRAVLNMLEEEGFVGGQLALKYYSWRQEAASKIQAGTYRLEVNQPVKEVVRKFTTGDTLESEVAITYPEGFTLDQIAARTAEKGIGTKEEFLDLASDPTQFEAEFPFLSAIPEGHSLEGYLFPDTYRVFDDDTPRDVILRMLANFKRRVVDSGLVSESERPLDEVVNMASIVEREVQTDEDMAMVAGVLWKRLEEGITLGADATIRYILNKHTQPLTVDDLAIDSPYNTRTKGGLPPTPISNPGLRALTASANPEESEFYYYLSAPSGETIFARTNDEHNANRVQYLR